MPTRERAVDRGNLRGRQLTLGIGLEIRAARVDRGLPLRVVAQAAGMSPAKLSRLERGLIAKVSVVELARVCAVVGLELSMRAFPAGDAIRDVAQVPMVVAFQALLHPTLRWQVEVPMPGHQDLRAWDGLVSGRGWRYGVEFESGPRDAQALSRRLQAKSRDGDVDGVLLVLRDTLQSRRFLEAASTYLSSSFPVSGRVALEALAQGRDPGGSAVIVLRRAHRRTRPLPASQPSEPLGPRVAS